MRTKALGCFFASLTFSVIVGLIWGLWVLLTKMVSGFVSLPVEIAAAIVAACATILVSVVSLVWSKALERQASVWKDLRDKKIPIYEDLVSFLFKAMFSEKAGRQKVTEQEMAAFLTDFTPKLIIWGSDDVVRAFSSFRAQSLRMVAEKPDPKQVMAQWEDLLYAIRLDLGHLNKQLKRGDVLTLFINDVKQHFAK